MFTCTKAHGILKRLCCLLAALLLCCGALAEAIPEPTEPPQYMDGDRDKLAVAQRRLIDLGLLSGGADGAYGPRTEAALRAFQAQNGLEETGHLDAVTFDRLTYVSPDAADARDVQQRLIDLGYLSGRADGIIGPKSVEALKLFQRINGLKATGKADDATLALLFSGDALPLPATLSGGDKGDDVLRLQQRLIQFGFMAGEADGSYGQSTTSAVRSFQRHLIEQGYSEGITASGAATALTQFCLYSDRYSTYLRDVKPGESDEEALRVERRLSQLGYMDLPADDVLDDYALEALKLFQDKCQAQRDGLADRETIDALFSDDAPLADYCAPHAIAAGDGGQAVEAVEAALQRGGIMTDHPSGSYGTTLEKNLERLYRYLLAVGDSRAELFSDPKALSADAQAALRDGLLGYRSDTGDENEYMRIQCRLHTLFYLPKAGIDGKPGPNTVNALKAFQSANGLVSTGEIDRATQDKLFSQGAVPKLYEYRVEVSIDRQRVEVFQLNQWQQYEPVQSFTCSTGLRDTTPRGIFLDGFPVHRWHFFKDFNCWAQYSFEITGDIMFHSVIYSSDNENSLRTGSLHALGNPASHGCVRLQVEDAKWLFEHCKRGTLVIVIY